MAEADAVKDEELLYRAVPNQAHLFPLDSEGHRRVSGQAFTDRQMRPSVDRAFLNGSDPRRTQREDADSILKITAAQVRAIGTTLNDEKGRPILDKTYVADVEPVPLPENPAHAEIFVRPEFESKSVFRRIIEQIARDAEWTILPADLRS